MKPSPVSVFILCGMEVFRRKFPKQIPRKHVLRMELIRGESLFPDECGL